MLLLFNVIVVGVVVVVVFLFALCTLFSHFFDHKINGESAVLMVELRKMTWKREIHGHIVGMPCVQCSNAITDNGNGKGKRMNREETTATPNDIHTTHNISLCTKTTKLIEKCSMRPNCVPMYIV